MTLSDRVEIPSQVMTRTVGEEVVMLDLASGTYFGLDPVGARIWELMVDGMTLGEIRDQMLAEYEVTQEEIERDILRLAEELNGQGLIQVAG
jgi:hypothetical protein